MHLRHDVGHGGQSVVVGVDDDVDTVAEDVEVAVGDQRRDLDQLVRAEPQAGHFTIDPHEFVLHEQHSSQAPAGSQRWTGPAGASWLEEVAH